MQELSADPYECITSRRKLSDWLSGWGIFFKTPFELIKTLESLILVSKTYFPLMFQGTGFWSSETMKTTPKFVFEVFGQELVGFCKF